MTSRRAKRPTRLERHRQLRLDVIALQTQLSQRDAAIRAVLGQHAPLCDDIVACVRMLDRLKCELRGGPTS